MSSLGSLSTLIVSKWDGFTQPEAARVTPLLGNGSASTGNAVMQQSALGWPVASISGTLLSQNDVDTLNGYADDKDQVAFVHDSINYVVYVFNLRISRLLVAGDAAWSYSCTLHQVG